MRLGERVTTLPAAGAVLSFRRDILIHLADIITPQSVSVRVEVGEEQFVPRGFAHRRDLLIRAGRRALEKDEGGRMKESKAAFTSSFRWPARYRPRF
jgi:hypothetical protein